MKRSVHKAHRLANGSASRNVHAGSRVLTFWSSLFLDVNPRLTVVFAKKTKFLDVNPYSCYHRVKRGYFLLLDTKFKTLSRCRFSLSYVLCHCYILVIILCRCRSSNRAASGWVVWRILPRLKQIHGRWVPYICEDIHAEAPWSLIFVRIFTKYAGVQNERLSDSQT